MIDWSFKNNIVHWCHMMRCKCECALVLYPVFWRLIVVLFYTLWCSFLFAFISCSFIIYTGSHNEMKGGGGIRKEPTKVICPPPFLWLSKEAVPLFNSPFRSAGFEIKIVQWSGPLTHRIILITSLIETRVLIFVVLIKETSQKYIAVRGRDWAGNIYTT